MAVVALTSVALALLSACDRSPQAREIVDYTIHDPDIRRDVLVALEEQRVPFRTVGERNVVVPREFEAVVDRAILDSNAARYPRCSLHIEDPESAALFLRLAATEGLDVRVIRNQKGPQYAVRESDCARLDAVFEQMVRILTGEAAAPQTPDPGPAPPVR